PRRHAEIVQTPRGYLVVDSSTNGTFVNEEQVQGQRILARTDVIRIGEEQFRFYAEAAPLTASSAPHAGRPASPEQLKHTVHGIEAVAAPRPSAAAFASFLVRSGGRTGQRLPVKTPVVNLGRAAYNDLVLPDPSGPPPPAPRSGPPGRPGRAPAAPPGPGVAAASLPASSPRHEACSPTAGGPAAGSQEG